MIAHVLRSRKIHTDDTPVKVLRPGEPQTRLGRFWVYCGDAPHPYTVYTFTLSRARDGPAQFLAGYGGYDGIAIDSAGKLQLVACGAHMRRKFLVMRAESCEVRLGGAGAVAALLRGLDADVLLAGVIGDDHEGATVRRLLDEAGIDGRMLLIDPARPTTPRWGTCWSSG
jgi:hypothetical protein